jgi:hypothetical protein
VQVLPFVIPAVYHRVLPSPGAYAGMPTLETASAAYAPLAADDTAPPVDTAPLAAGAGAKLCGKEKWALVRPLLARYMLPLCAYSRACAFASAPVLAPVSACGG